MPDPEAGASGGDTSTQTENAQAGAEQKPADTPTGSEAAGGGNEDGGGKTPAKPGTENAKAPSKEPASNDDNDEPAVRTRKTPADYIKARQEKRDAKAKAALEAEAGGETELEDEINPTDRELITKVVSPILEPLLASQIKAENDQEVAAFLKDNPEFEKFEAKAKRYMAHPSRAHLPVEAVFYEVAGKALIKIGADRERKASEEARNTQTGGGSNRGGEGSGKNAWEMTPEEFEAEQLRVMSAKAD